MKTLNYRLRSTLVLAASLALTLSACNNGKLKKTKTEIAAPLAQLSTQSEVTGANFRVSSVQEATEASIPVFKINVQNQSAPLNSVCNTAQPCVCSARWIKLNNDGTVQTVRHPTQAAITVTANQITCSQPAEYQSASLSPPNGTLILISIRRSADTSVSVSNDVTIRKGDGTTNTLNQTGVFQDIARYTCSDTYSRDKSIFTGVSTVTNTDANGRTTKTYIARSTRFCLPGTAASNGTNTSSQYCQTSPVSDTSPSNQRNVYNFYTRSNNPSVTSSNGGFTCAQIDQGIEAATNKKPYPLDRSFSLAGISSADFYVPVEANVKVSGGPGDPSSTGLACGTSQVASPEGASTIVGCLGFAAKPNFRGACPNVSINGAQVPTYRLRKYFAVFPQQFELDGSPKKKAAATANSLGSTGAQSVDTVYVLDRPVTNSAGALIATVAGPKPCPFAYRDVNKVISSTDTTYYATNDEQWRGRNLDGIRLPFSAPSPGTQIDGCVARYPVYESIYTNNAALKFAAAGPTTPLSNYYIRPIQPWALHYEEDTSFQACAPRALQPVDPPIHLLNNAGTVPAYCAETHPNAIWTNSNPGSVHTRQDHTDASPHQIGSDTVGGSGVSAPLPLLAPKADIERALGSDPSFRCSVTGIFAQNTAFAIGTTNGISACCVGAPNNHFEPGAGSSAVCNVELRNPGIGALR